MYSIKKCVCNLFDKSNCVIHIRILNEALNLGLVLKKVHRIIQFKQRKRLKSYIDRNTKLRTKAKNDFEISFLG